jgi:NADH:ubiquinone oxidoreductase subunit 6 (subunit J)
MSLYTVIFYFFEAMAAVSALLLIFTRNVFYGALLLITCLLAIAGIYVLSFAEFIAVTQIMVYAGGVLVLIIFGIMLTVRLGEKPLAVEHVNIFSAAIIGVALLTILCAYLKPPRVPTPRPINTENTLETIGSNLLTEYLIPFEIAGILLLAALVGAAVIASPKSKEA